MAEATGTAGTAAAASRWGSTLDSVVVYAQGALCRRLARGSVPPGGLIRVTGLPRALDPGSLRARVLGPSGVRVTEARVEIEAEPLGGDGGTTGSGSGTAVGDGGTAVSGGDTAVSAAAGEGSAGPSAADSGAAGRSAPGGGAGEPRAAGGLRQEVERLRDAYAAAAARRDRQLGLIAEVSGLRPIAPARKREDPHRRTPVDAWLELADFVDERLTGLHARLVALEEELRQAEHELSVAADRLDRASTAVPSAHVATTYTAVLTLAGASAAQVDGEAAGQDGPDLEVELEYGVPGAVWVPAYRLTHRQGDGTGRLVLRASVAQRTGEDWTGVRIALATADLRRRTDLPKLRSIRIGRRQDTPAPSGWREPPAGLADLFAGYASAGPRPAPRPAAVAVGAGWGSGAVPAPSRPSLGGPPPPPPQAAGGYGAAPVAPPIPGGGYGAAPGAAGGGHAETAEAYLEAAPDRARRAPAQPGGRPRFGGAPAGPPAPAAMAPAAPFMPAAPVAAGAPPMAPGAAVPPPPPAPVAGPPQPSGAELDYGALVLCGPDEPEHRRGRLFPGARTDAVATEYRRRAEAVAALPLPGHAVRPRESAGSFDHRFDAAARADVPSDGGWHTVTVGEVPVGLRTEYLCVPSVEPTVYATLVLSNATDQALLAGPVEVTVDDEFLLTAALPTLAPGAVRRVGLGPAECIRVTRRSHLTESTAGLRNNITVLDHRVHVELSNGLARPVTVEVRERVPVTSEPDVRIEERPGWTAPETGTEPERHTPGTRLRRVDLPAGGTTAIDGGYEIRIPAGKALVGGNRRS
ncbi:DUF4139 domain-containing protein [Streptomyces venezuelae]|uniref:DUF4139 domain-containing protein n=1 Tax=Streptomyces venezuelae TaxID=54571 RepID=UPI001CC25C5D|nr:DUF4139 domain-containing protein [Streptomyces venezuelae]